jgi:hypothetical protein
MIEHKGKGLRALAADDFPNERAGDGGRFARVEEI